MNQFNQLGRSRFAKLVLIATSALAANLAALADTAGPLVAWGAGTTTTGTNNYGQSIVPADLGACALIAAGGYHTLAIQAPAAPCYGDLDGSGEVDSGDFGLVLLSFGPCQ